MQVISTVVLISMWFTIASCKTSVSRCAKLTPIQMGEEVYTALANPTTVQMLYNNPPAVKKMKECISAWVGDLRPALSPKGTARLYNRNFVGYMLQWSFLAQLTEFGRKIPTGKKFDVKCFSTAVRRSMSWDKTGKDWRRNTVFWTSEMVNSASQNCKDAMTKCLGVKKSLQKMFCIDSSNICISAAANEKQTACAAGHSAATAVTTALFLMRVQTDLN